MLKILQRMKTRMFFISVHVNAIPQEKWRGAQVFYHKGGDPGGESCKSNSKFFSVTNLKNTDREALSISGVVL